MGNTPETTDHMPSGDVFAKALQGMGYQTVVNADTVRRALDEIPKASTQPETNKTRAVRSSTGKKVGLALATAGIVAASLTGYGFMGYLTQNPAPWNGPKTGETEPTPKTPDPKPVTLEYYTNLCYLAEEHFRTGAPLSYNGVLYDLHPTIVKGVITLRGTNVESISFTAVEARPSN